MNCPKCGGNVYINRDTASGYEVERSICWKCGWENRHRGGKALWRVWQEAAPRPGLLRRLWNRIKGD